MIDQNRLEYNLNSVQRNIQKYNPKAQLVCVTKKYPVQLYELLMGLNIKHIAESYVQEALEKRELLQESYQKKVKWHFIGQIQSNKIKLICQHFDVVHSLDKIKHAKKINETLQNMQKKLDVMIHVNLAHEQSKTGIEASTLKDFILKLNEFESIRCVGLMTFPPYAKNPQDNQKYFKQLFEILHSHQVYVKHTHAFEHLSMGVSNDYIVALQQGASMIRLGTSLFGQRDQPLV